MMLAENFMNYFEKFLRLLRLKQKKILKSDIKKVLNAKIWVAPLLVKV